MTGVLLAVEHLEVKYGDLIGVADVSLVVPKGSVVALLRRERTGVPLSARPGKTLLQTPLVV